VAILGNGLAFRQEYGHLKAENMWKTPKTPPENA
jgi:hypothetical protein